MIAGAVVVGILWWLLGKRSSPEVSIGDDYAVDFIPTGDGTPWSDAYKTKPGDPP